jgi:phosphosulfolactate synthase (CoM biosynthesis protein A)
MPMSVDNYIQVATDGSGKKVRNLEMVVVLPSGAEHTVEVQVVAHVGPDGRLVNVDTTKIVAELQELRQEFAELKSLWEEVLSPDLRQSMINKKTGRYSRASKESC